MANGQTPNLVGKDEIKLTKKTVYTLSCPKCDKDIDVTSVNPNTYIECKSCQNITWRPDYNPPWWAKTWKFVVSLIVAFFIGLISDLVKDAVKQKFFNNPVSVNTDSANIKKLDSVRQHIIDSINKK